MLDNLVRFHTPEGARATKAKGGVEHHLTEGAVMVAFAMHLLRTVEGMQHVAIHPDGEHAKHFPSAEWLAAQGFERLEAKGTTAYGGHGAAVAIEGSASETGPPRPSRGWRRRERPGNQRWGATDRASEALRAGCGRLGFRARAGADLFFGTLACRPDSG